MEFRVGDSAELRACRQSLPRYAGSLTNVPPEEVAAKTRFLCILESSRLSMGTERT